MYSSNFDKFYLIIASWEHINGRYCIHKETMITSTHNFQARNQDFMWGGGANEAKVDQTTEMYFLLSDPFI